MLRVPLGATDFSPNGQFNAQCSAKPIWVINLFPGYVLDKNSDDVNLTGFSQDLINSDTIQVLKDILSINNEVKLILVPWTAVRSGFTSSK